LFLDAPHLHAEVLSFNDYCDSKRLKGILDAVTDLGGEPLLNLQPPGVGFHNPGDLAQTGHMPIRNISHMGFPDKGQQVVLTETVYFYVLDQDHLAVIFMKGGRAQHFDRIQPVSVCKVLHGLGYAHGCFQETFAPGIFTDQIKYLPVMSGYFTGLFIIVTLDTLVAVAVPVIGIYFHGFGFFFVLNSRDKESIIFVQKSYLRTDNLTRQMSGLIVIPTLLEASSLIRSAGFIPAGDANLYDLPGSGWKLFIPGFGTVPVLYNMTRHLSLNRYDKVVHAGIAGSYFLPLQPGEAVQVTRDTFADIGVDSGGVFRWVFHEGLWAPDEKPFRSGWLEVQEDPSLHLECVSGITVDLITGSPARKVLMEKKFNPQTESMEGAAVFYVCKMFDLPVIQIRAISNYTGIRDRYNWKTEEAIEAFTQVITRML